MPAKQIALRAVKSVPALPARAKDSNKGDFGKILVVGGCRGMAGAPCLAGRAAGRGGAGLVRVVVPESIWDVAAIKLDECLTEGLAATPAGCFAATAFDRVFELSQWADVVVMGPGMSQAADTSSLIRRAILECERTLVLDADALNAFGGGNIRKLKAAQEKWPRRAMVLTPHPGECGRLLGMQTSRVQADRTSAVRQAVEATNAVVVLKGAGTLVCDGRRLYKNTTGNPGMATGGTGDVLSGLIGALIGQGLEAFEAACLGTYLHGLAGDIAAKRLGEWSMLAGDLLEALPDAFLAHANRRTDNGKA